jgi:outer membrane protein assembly factor BamB
MVLARGVRLVCAGLLLLAAAGCNPSSDDPDPAAAGPSVTPETPAIPSVATPQPTGPAAAWTVPMAFSDIVTEAGSVLLQIDRTLVRALRWTDGKELWRYAPGQGTRVFRVLPTAGGLAVETGRGDESESVVMLDPDSGDVRWRTDPAVEVVVYRDAVYLDTCRRGPQPCTVTSRATRDGRVLWRTRAPRAVSILAYTIGTRGGTAPVAGRYLAAQISSGKGLHGEYAAIETATGRIMPPRLAGHAWHGVIAGNVLAATDHEASGPADCTVRITSLDIRTGRPRPPAAVQSAREASGTCVKRLAGFEQGQDLLGKGGRFAAVLGDRPVLYDVEAGRLAWKAATPGVPVDGDAGSLLVREQYEKGRLSLLDLATGRMRWSAPDPGLDGTSASWRTKVTGGLVAVTGATVAGQPHVLVYDAGTGVLKGRYPGWLANAGDDWVAVSGGGELKLVQF